VKIELAADKVGQPAMEYDLHRAGHSRPSSATSAGLCQLDRRTGLAECSAQGLSSIVTSALEAGGEPMP
jgi:hypothetical protein